LNEKPLTSFYSIPTNVHFNVEDENKVTICIPEAHCQLEGLQICELVAVELGVEVGAESQAHCQEADQ
jgi:hypothetical protein